MEKHDYWQKNPDLKLFSDLSWNIPEQKSGTINVIGGNASGFNAVSSSSEHITKSFPIKNVNIALPDSLKSKLPPLPSLTFLPSTESGSIGKSPLLNELMDTADFNLLIGDFSKNSATSVAITEAIRSTNKPVLLTRDAVDLVLPEMVNLIERDNLFLVASAAQIQKVFRAVYYPKMLLLSMPLLPFIEALHKFTLTYKTTILTFHEGQIIVANSGAIITTPLEKTIYSPITLWNGNLAANIAALNLFNPSKPLDATTFSIGYSPKLV